MDSIQKCLDEIKADVTAVKSDVKVVKESYAHEVKKGKSELIKHLLLCLIVNRNIKNFPEKCKRCRDGAVSPLTHPPHILEEKVQKQGRRSSDSVP